ncbi:M24 family metallopeptidase [Sediminibacterium salmoneum]|uniref:M24 family metallopeptidase n=1 Tax=Sediminibacterium salmoneum TaxID=426421 RepID=UPI0004786CB2|nr:M24 family metallopeptidase [Sediminibacterium salmoneum]
MNQLIRKVYVIGFLFLFPVLQMNAQVLPLRDQARVIDEILDERLNQLLPKLMEKTGIDMWVMITREYNEDPIVRTFLPATWISARRTTMLVFYYNPATKEYTKSAVARYNVGSSIKAAWDMTKYPDQYDALMAIIQQHQPKKIGINTSVSYGHADGLDHTAYEQFMQKIPAKFKSAVVSAEPLAVAWLETRTEREMQIYPQVIEISKAIIAEGFSSKVITPGITTSEDLVWWYRQKINQLGLSTWFHPSVEIQRNDATTFDHLTAFSNKGHDAKNIIQQGDLLHVDFGITYLRLNSDIQEHAYVLKPGEKDAPEYLKNALAVGNRLQDILTNQFALNRTGNAILKDALAQAKKEGINATIYTHPIGSHGHAAGPTIGMWDMQNGVPGSGDYPMYYQTAYSIELNAAVEIKEWKKTIRIMLEQDGYFDQNGFRYISGRQTKLHLVGNAGWQ